VRLLSDTGSTVTLEDGWTYVEQGAVSSVVPGSGQYGTEVVISGTGLRGGGGRVDSVTLGATAVLQIVSETDDTVVVIANRTLDVPVTSAQGIVLIADSGAVVTADEVWTDLVEGTIDQVYPTSGQYGTLVTITGERLFGGGNSVAVSLAGVAVESVDVSDSTTIVVEAAASPDAVTGDVVIVADSGAIVTAFSGFTYLEQGAVAHVSPRSGQLGTYVNIFGENLLGGGTSLESITLNSASPYVLTSITDSRIQLRAAGSDQLGIGDITIISNTGAIVSLENGWTYDVPSNITDVCI